MSKKSKNFLLEAVVKLFMDLPKGKVLDLATGYGFLPVEMSKLGFEVTSLDRFDEMIELAKQYFLENKVNIKMVKSDVVRTPFKEKEFDIVTAVSIAEHLSEKTKKDSSLVDSTNVLLHHRSP